jgi:hypothetical protein
VRHFVDDQEYWIVSSIVPVTGVSAIAVPLSRPQADQSGVGHNGVPTAAATTVTRQVEPIRYYGGINGMNATNLIVALQSNVAISGGYSAQAIETGGTPPPSIIDRAV